MTVRERTEQIEKNILSCYAALSSKSLGRKIHENKCNFRTVYQQDRDRIIHCKSFRRLKHKTQVFLSPKGDHYRTRLTHTLEVSQIARTISRAMLLNEDLTEAIALGHDLGHSPFGHAGENALNNISLCGFKHYEQSIRIIDKLERDGKGLNLTLEVCDGILCHTKGPQPYTMEGQVVRLSDRIAYLNHDIDDAIRAGILSPFDIPKDIKELLGVSHSDFIGNLIQSLINNSNNGTLKMDNDIQNAFDDLYKFMCENIYHNNYAKAEEKKVPKLIEYLFNYFKINYKKMPPDMQKIALEEGIDKAVCDYISGMTDLFAIQTFESIYIPKPWNL